MKFDDMQTWCNNLKNKLTDAPKPIFFISQLFLNPGVSASTMNKLIP
jgi:hypothetical protein